MRPLMKTPVGEINSEWLDMLDFLTRDEGLYREINFIACHAALGEDAERNVNGVTQMAQGVSSNIADHITECLRTGESLSDSVRVLVADRSGFGFMHGLMKGEKTSPRIEAAKMAVLQAFDRAMEQQFSPRPPIVQRTPAEALSWD